jgi:hypothetical protein
VQSHSIFASCESASGKANSMRQTGLSWDSGPSNSTHVGAALHQPDMEIRRLLAYLPISGVMASAGRLRNLASPVLTSTEGKQRLQLKLNVANNRELLRTRKSPSHAREAFSGGRDLRARRPYSQTLSPTISGAKSRSIAATERGLKAALYKTYFGCCC